MDIVSQDVLLLEKTRKAKDEAIRSLNNEQMTPLIRLDAALLDEILMRLRRKAQRLHEDKWMYEDVQI
ncbi:hypothetical protein CCR75_004508 [Bremia lactucae]|uniref:Uncharacterized protein n=1 Tax=Bremia lactucae TaxID=4779 RepID=A0A976FKQ3_BRELC|nr:hypothetical protein CCR75_004508 [Bremia lactucae]